MKLVDDAVSRSRGSRRPAAYVPKDNIIDIELSEYAGYAG